jgi:hypothetical protein
VRRASTAVLVLLLVALGVLPALGATPLRGTVKKSFTATGENGRVTTAFKTTTPQVYASFIWLHAPTAGQRLEIDWFGPTGSRVAEWKNETLATDTTGTRIFSFIHTTTLSKRPGSWRVILLVGGVERAALHFTVAKP